MLRVRLRGSPAAPARAVGQAWGPRPLATNKGTKRGPRRPLSAATPRGIVVTWGLVLEDRRKAWVHILAGTNDISRLGVMNPCSVGRSTDGNKKA